MSANEISVPNQLDFAQEVRAERLSVLWKVTLVLIIFVVWGSLILTSLQQASISDVVLPVVLAVLGCLFCRAFLLSRQYPRAVWSYILGLLLALAFVARPPAEGGADVRQYVMFVYPLIVLMMGFLLPLRSTIITFVIGVAITIFGPLVGHPDVPFAVTGLEVFVIFLMALALGIASQMSGALYGIAEWALESYRKERETKDKLFDTQQEIQRSFLRQKALSEQLQETNVELEAARASAIEAKNFRGQFLANMSHELRTPLNAIIGFSETMLNFPMMYENQPLPPAY
ncbi:MAG TPA: histidine kinase dimerization/phospho-acceptor domain-containing protein, partial [Aggregatilineales bacterium]|nr:histidine kinase dimerization/phospho-acceptor domain-containing protein [Aggregatilineales bacterium]